MTTDSSHDHSGHDPLAHDEPDQDVRARDGAGDDPTAAADDVVADDVVADAQEAIQDARQRLAEIPAEVVVTNHVMGLYELAAIHLSSPTPDLRSAALAIDAVACLVDGLGERLGEDAPTMRDALANIRMAFVQIKAAHANTAPNEG